MIHEGTDGKGTCFGDSGGPLATFSGKTLVGLTSFGNERCDTNRKQVVITYLKLRLLQEHRMYYFTVTPGVYTRMRRYAIWIGANTRDS